MSEYRQVYSESYVKFLEAKVDKLTAEYRSCDEQAQRFRAEIEFWKQSSNKYWEQAMQYRKQLDHYEGIK